MKIYCSRAHKTSLDDFIGTEFWVRVIDSAYNFTTTPMVRILRKDNDGTYIINMLSEAYLELSGNPVTSNTDWVNYIFGIEFKRNPRHISLFEPVEVMTTDEVIDAIQRYDGESI